MASQLFILVLCFIAGVVAIGLMKKRNMWRWIVAYWVVLTLKNIVDFVWG